MLTCIPSVAVLLTTELNAKVLIDYITRSFSINMAIVHAPFPF